MRRNLNDIVNLHFVKYVFKRDSIVSVLNHLSEITSEAVSDLEKHHVPFFSEKGSKRTILL